MTITIEPAAGWCIDLERRLGLAAVHATADDLRKHHEAGAACFWVLAQGVRCGAYMLRIEALAAGREGVVIAAEGDLEGVSLFDTVMPFIENQFRDAGCKTVRVHTSRPGVAKKLKAHGYGLSEVVTCKTL